MRKAKDLRDQSLVELEATRDSLRKELFELYNDNRRAKKNEQPHRPKQIKKDIARVLTVMHEKKNEHVTK